MLRKSFKVVGILLELAAAIYVMIVAHGFIMDNDFAIITKHQLTSEGMIVMGEIVIATLIIVVLASLYILRMWRATKVVQENTHELQKEREALRAILRKVS